MQQNHTRRNRTKSMSMQAAKVRVLRTSRLFLLPPAIALTVAACNDNPTPQMMAQAPQQGEELRDSASESLSDRGGVQLARNDDDDDRDDDRDRD